MNDRKSALQQIKQLKRKADQECSNVNYLTGYICALSTVEGILAEEQWIPCSERLPEEVGYYYVTQYNENAVDEYCDGYRTDRIFFDNNGWWDDVDAAFDWEIIAWMPLPEPYREEKKDE